MNRLLDFHNQESFYKNHDSIASCVKVRDGPFEIINKLEFWNIKIGAFRMHYLERETFKIISYYL